MKKIIPVLFVSTTTLIAVVGVCGTFNGSFRQLHAEDHEYTVTFAPSDITSHSVKSGWPETGTFTFSKKTKSNFDFGCTATVKGDDVMLKSSGHMANVEMESDRDEGVIQMTFEFHNVSSVVSVVLNGKIWVGSFDRNFATYTNAVQTSDGFNIVINETSQKSFYIDSIVVKYTCSY